MNDTIDSILIAFSLIANKEDYLVEIVILSLRVSLFATFYASILGLSLAALLAVFKIPGKFLMVAVINGFLGLPCCRGSFLISHAIEKWSFKFFRTSIYPWGYDSSANYTYYSRDHRSFL